jgi:hypothetical protein
MGFATIKQHARLSFVIASGWLVACTSPTSTKVKLDAGSSMDATTPKPTTLPGGYRPSISCGDLGRACSVDKACPAGLACLGSTCLPDTAGGAPSCGTDPCPASAPACVASVCVTFDQLACLCLEPASRDIVPQCQSVASIDAGASCLSETALCDVRPDACCTGLSCLKGTSTQGTQTLGICGLACKADADCDSNCCVDSPALASRFCAPHDACVQGCRKQDQRCDSDRNPCCGSLVCVQSPQDPALNGCKVACSQDRQCDTGCCILFMNADGGLSDRGACGPADRCK